MTSLFFPLVIILGTSAVSHLLFCRVVRPRKFIVTGLIWGLFWIVIGSVTTPTLEWDFRIALIILAVAAWNIYLFVLINFQNSVSLKTLDTLDLHGGEIQEAELENLISAQKLFDSRVSDMIANGMILPSSENKEHTLVAQPKAVLLGKILLGIRRGFGITTYG